MAGAHLNIKEDPAETQDKGSNPLPKLPSREEFLGHGVRFLCSTGEWIRDLGAKASSQVNPKEQTVRPQGLQRSEAPSSVL